MRPSTRLLQGYPDGWGPGYRERFWLWLERACTPCTLAPPQGLRRALRDWAAKRGRAIWLKETGGLCGHALHRHLRRMPREHDE